MSTQELLTFLFNAIALGFTVIAAMDFATRSVAAYNQVTVASNSPSTNIQQQLTQAPPSINPQKLPQLPDPWLLPLEGAREILPVSLVATEQKHLRLLPQAKQTSTAVAPQIDDLLLGVNIDKLKLRQARKIAKVLGIAQKVNGRDQKLTFLVSQIKVKLQQAKKEIIEVVKQELIAC